MNSGKYLTEGISIFGLMMVFIIVIVLFEGPGILKRKELKEILTVTTLVLLSLVYGLDYTLQLHLLPNPKVLVYKIFPLAEQYETIFNLRH